MTQLLSGIGLVSLALSPVILFLLVPMLFPPSRKPWVARASIISGLVIGTGIFSSQYASTSAFCAQNPGITSDCNGSWGGLVLFGAYFGLFALFGVLRLAVDGWQAVRKA